MWEISNNNQIITFVLSLLLGCIFCLLYDILRALRKVCLNSFMAINICDLICWIIYGFITFIFLIARTNGEIRGFVLLGELIGFVLFRVSISKYIVGILGWFFIKLAYIKQKIDGLFYLYFDKSEKGVLKTIKYVPKIFKSIKKFLKSRLKLLYNKLNIIDVKRSLNETETKT